MMKSVKASVLGFCAERFGWPMDEAIIALKESGAEGAAKKIKDIVLANPELIPQGAYIQKGINALREMNSVEAVVAIADIVQTYTQFIPDGFNALKYMAKANLGVSGQAGSLDDNWAVQITAVTNIKRTALLRRQYIPQGIETLKEIDTNMSAKAIQSIAEEFEEAIPQAFDALQSMTTYTRIRAIANIMRKHTDAILPGMKALKAIHDKANLPERKSIVAEVDDIMLCMCDKFNNVAVRDKVDVLTAIKEASFPVGEFNYKAMLYSIAADPTAVSEFCMCGGEKRVSSLRSVFEGASANLKTALEHGITHAQDLRALTPE